MMKVALGVMLGCTVLIVGCVALIGAGAQQVQKESDKTAITVEQYGSAKVGEITRAQIEKRFGEPESAQDVQAAGVEGVPESALKQSCVYYNRKGKIASLFQFCFDGDGRLESKSSF